MTAILATGTTYDDLIRFLRERAVALKMTDKDIEAIGGFTPGHVGKLLGAKRTKHLGGLSMGMMLGALGLKFAIVEDAEATARIKARYDPSEKTRRELATASLTITPQLAEAVFAHHLGRIAQSGGRARAQSLSPVRRAAIARKAGKASARKRKMKSSMGTF